MTGSRIGVVGAGLMGAAIAQVFAAGGHDVDLYDPDPEVLVRALPRIEQIFELLDLPPEGARRVTAHGDLEPAVAQADFVVEAGPERLAVKQEIFERLSELASPDAILASNTSAIPIREVVARVADPSRTVGTHFWNPPYCVPLVEVVQSDATSSETVDRTMALLERVGMKPVHVRADVPGFVGNRLQHALKREAIALVASGVCDAETLDTVVKYGFGRRLATLGPLEQSDLIGLDLTLDIHRVLMPSLDTTSEPHPYLVAKVEAGDLGMKTGRGFRDWTPEEAQAVRDRLDRELLDAARLRR
jgi:3-hydroxybutyryl-CoA dehydrogenase